MLFIIIVSSVVFAASGGSGYSRYGIGDLRYFNSGRSAGMGGAGLALLPSNTIGQLNPAAWTNIFRTQFSVGMLYEGFSTADSATSAFLSGMNFNGAAFAFPVVSSSGITLAVGLTPYSTINYHIVSPQSNAGLLYDVEYIGEGGISLGFLGSSVKIGNSLHLGAKLNYYFGTMRHTVSQQFADNSLFTDVENLRTLSAKGIGITIGGVYTGFRNVFHLEESSFFNLGVVFSTPASMSATEEHLLTYTTSSATSRDTIYLPESSFTLPLSLGVGIAYGTERYALAADVSYQPWRDVTGTGVMLPPRRNSVRLSFGGELLPKREPTTFVERVAYRAGFFYHASYYRIRSQAINEIGFTAGCGLPVISDTRLNIGIEYSFRGTTVSQLQKDKILRISFTLNGGEQWFYRPPEE